MMYNSGKIITGIVIFLAIFTFPFWSQMGKAAAKPEPKLPAKEVATKCVMDTQYMRTSHMVMLNDWRDSVVRDGNRDYKSEADGKAYTMSLSNTCMECHTDKAKFCDSCHNYLGVKPYCWDCHLEPKQPEEKK